VSYSSRCSMTIRTARSRSSCGYLPARRVMAPSCQGREPPGNSEDAGGLFGGV
jgi:hypothetical protein